MKTSSIAVRALGKKIHSICGQKVMLDSDLAELYGVTTGNLNLAVRRNKDRFPSDFMFQLNNKESLILQIASSTRRGGRRRPPFSFTEQGVAMLSSVLKSERAIRINVAIMRAFVQIRDMASFNKEMNLKIEELERKIGINDVHIRDIFQSLRELVNPPMPVRKKIGFR